MTELLFRDQPYLRSTPARIVSIDARGLRLDRTVFYANSGGQPGDSGRLVLADGRAIPIVDALKGEGGDDVVHVPAPDATDALMWAAAGTDVVAEIDWARRHRLMRMHTCMHLLSALLPFPVTGGQVGDGKGRLDFDMADAPPDKDALTLRLNELVSADAEVRPRWITGAELEASPDLVKTMAVKPPMGMGRVRLIEIAGIGRPLDVQACGGTHVARTGEIGPVRVAKIESKGRRNRRVVIEFAGA
jgi:misacylated tRNA(Ala) deacylase